MKTLFTAIAFIMLALPTGLMAQEDGKDEKVEEPTLGYADDPVQTIDESVLMQRIEEVTEVVNTHTEQIKQLDENDGAFDKRLASIESLLDGLTKPLETKATVKSSGSWGTTLAKPGKLSYGSTGSAPRSWSSSSLLSRLSAPVVSYGSTGSSLPGRVTSVSYGQPVITSIGRPVVTSVQSTPYVPTAPIVTQPTVVSYGPTPAPVQPTNPVVSSNVSTTTRRVRIPVQATTQSTTTYSPVTNTSRGRLGGRLLTPFLGRGGCPPGATNCPN